MESSLRTVLLCTLGHATETLWTQLESWVRHFTHCHSWMQLEHRGRHCTAAVDATGTFLDATGQAVSASLCNQINDIHWVQKNDTESVAIGITKQKLELRKKHNLTLLYNLGR